MKKTLIIGCAIAISGNALAQDFVGNATMVWEGQIGQKANTGLGAQDAADIYSNKTTFTGSAFSNGGATLIGANTITRMAIDNLVAVAGGVPIEGFTFSVSNLDAAIVTARPRVRFYADNAGTPGTVIAGYSFSAISFNPGTVGLFNATIAAINVPADGKFWAGITFDNNSGATGATAANLNNLGQGIYNPPTIGTSADSFWYTTAAGDFLSNNPAGASTFFSGNPVANFGWSLNSSAVPEPASMAVLGLGALGLLRRRRSSK